MKKTFLATTALILSASVSLAQTNTGTAVPPDQAVADKGNTAYADQDTKSPGNSAVTRIFDFADAWVGDTKKKDGDTRATANGGPGVQVASGEGGKHSVGVASNAANGNVQFQVGNLNQSINVQSGVLHESATLQVGNENDAIISQADWGSEAAIAQTGKLNSTVIIQTGTQQAAASASQGDKNSSVILQKGADNVAANAILGDENAAMIFQNNGKNSAAQLQVGKKNQTFISQGGGTENSLLAIDGTQGSVKIPGGLTATQAVANAASMNAAASMQLGDNNRSAIIQQGDNNEAVNYQNSM